MFYIATPDDIKNHRSTDVYFRRASKVLRAKGIDKHVRTEFVVKRFPNNYPWGVFAGLEEVMELLDGQPVNIAAMNEGTIFRANEPVMTIEGKYLDFAELETPILGFMCHASGVATKAARCRLAADGRQLIHFGARRVHPAIAPMVDRSSYIGGFDGVATLLGAELLGLEPSGTIPHAMILLFGDTVEAIKAFNEVIEPAVKRVALIDTYNDEKFEAIRVAEALGKDLYAVRLDTPGSRRGNFLAILKEVRWELDLRGFSYVKLFVSGGIDENTMKELNGSVDAYGIGTAISGAPVLDFAMDIIEIEGTPAAKRGKLSGAKQVYANERTGEREILPATKKMVHRGFVPLLEPLAKNGKLLHPLPTAAKIRSFVLSQLKDLSL
ncbi:MAG: nicotinate phosphoribosyltransferase [Ignavibacteriales bacterium CG07_land_8_20_14_0_80_59_12]|jgi:nicotinate phosphoribosyltransferase|nr:MAG: nicotinate phosphoribosyltransferase [Ignavibacteriales bacterium CG07_land_8_20_14_0_80_59_12]